MRALVVYEPVSCGPGLVAHEVAAGMSTHLSTEVVEVGQALARLGDEVDLLVLGAHRAATGASRHWSRLAAGGRPELRPAGLREWLALLPWARDVRRTAVFDVEVPGEGGSHVRRSAAADTVRLLRRRRYDVVSPPVTFRTGAAGTYESARPHAWGRDVARAAVLGTSVDAGPAFCDVFVPSQRTRLAPARPAEA